MTNSRYFLIVPFLLVALLCAAGCISSNNDVTNEVATASQTPSVSSSGTATPGNIVADISAMDVVMPGIYYQFPNQNITFIDFTLTNNGNADTTVTVESEISGYTEMAINTVIVPAKETVTIGQTPLFKQGQIPSERTNAQLHYLVKSDGNIIDEQTNPVTIYAKDTMVWAVDDGNESTDMSEFIGAWVTPHATGIDKLIRTAANYQKDKSMNGYQCGEACVNDAQWADYTNEQVKAIYSALQKDYALTYINTPISFSKNSDSTQKVRLPADSLASGSANCIDGTVLYASALESLGINPHVIVLPTHAFVCYDTSDNQYSTEVCLETTMTGSASFEDAIAEGNDEYAQEEKEGNFESQKSMDLSVSDLREKGILPFQ
ncbi:MAG: hypothetical protein ABFC78_04510 [Methanoregula sp.]